MNKIINSIKEKIENSTDKKYKIRLDKFLTENFSFENNITPKIKEKIDIFEKELLKTEIVMTLRNTVKQSLLTDFKNKKDFKQITFELKQEKTFDNENQGSIEIVEGNASMELRNYQAEAILQLNTKIKETPNHFKGLLVVPTGGGKTFIAMYWLMKYKINEGAKVLWLAHRHSLLDQAKDTLINASYKNILPDKDVISYHIISGIHDKPVEIKKDTDIIFAGKDSLQNIGLKFLLENWVKYQKEVFIVIDEAHHATARTYRNIVDKIENYDKNLKINILGLTATPIRTAEKEQGLIERVFPNGIIDGGISLKKLINDGHLANPNFEKCKTNFKFERELSEKEINRINNSDLPPDLAGIIAANSDRNNFIFEKYKNGNYGKTIIFAIDQIQARTLKGIFDKKYEGKVGIVVSGTFTSFTNASVSREDNQKTLAQFKEKGGLDILINVNILSEGVDVPDVQTIFLTRPTTSTILMTQMIGRGLRRSEGKTECKIVSFIDEIDKKIYWENPEKAFIDNNIDFLDADSKEYQKQIARLISISKIEEFARLCDGEVDKELIDYGFIERIPIGFYGFFLEGNRHDVMVFEHLHNAYQDFINDLRNTDFLHDYKENNPDEVISSWVEYIQYKYFNEKESFGFQIIDIERIIKSYAENETLPKYTAFEDRAKYDLDKIVANFIKNENTDFDDFKKSCWENNKKYWELIFGEQKNRGFLFFRKQCDHLKDKIKNPDDYKISSERPKITFAKKHIADCRSIYEMKKYFPKEGLELEAKVWAGSRYKDVPKSERFKYQIDHIIRVNDGGKTIFENLEVLLRKEHNLKTTKENRIDRAISI